MAAEEAVASHPPPPSARGQTYKITRLPVNGIPNCARSRRTKDIKFFDDFSFSRGLYPPSAELTIKATLED